MICLDRASIITDSLIRSASDHALLEVRKLDTYIVHGGIQRKEIRNIRA
jgi:hypothetical protein